MARKPSRSYPGPLRRPAASEEISGDAFLIASEGEVTEIDYFEGTRVRLRRLPETFEVFHPRVTDPVQLVQAAMQRRAERDLASAEGLQVKFSQTWVLIDREHQHCERREQIAEARELAATNNILIAVSNPCFELWLMLHYRERPGAFRDGRHCRKELLKHIPKYQKKLTAPMIEELLHRDQISKAVRHARQCEEYHTTVDGEGDGNPSSEVYRLLLTLNAAVPRDRRLF